jgi:hypothetical protein
VTHVGLQANNLIEKPWRKARESVEVKLLAQDHELYVFARSGGIEWTAPIIAKAGRVMSARCG